MLEAYHTREERDWRRTAWLAAHIGPMVWSKRAYTADELLGLKSSSTMIRDPQRMTEAFHALAVETGGFKGH
jgi:hypothetical protein